MSAANSINHASNINGQAERSDDAPGTTERKVNSDQNY
jgi:hypothetical protein